MPLHYYPINCAETTEQDLRELLHEIRALSPPIIVHLDEVHRLASRQRDHLLLQPLRDIDATWIATSVSVTGLEDMFLNRFSVKLTTELPRLDELRNFVMRRCDDWNISVEDDNVLTQLINNARLNCASVLGVLARAAMSPSAVVTRELVANHTFHVAQDEY